MIELFNWYDNRIINCGNYSRGLSQANLYIERGSVVYFLMEVKYCPRAHIYWKKREERKFASLKDKTLQRIYTFILS